MNQPEQPRSPEAEREPAPPRIYIASLSDYNAGRLHGSWISLNEDADAMWNQVNEMLAASPEPGAEEWAIHDYDGFGPLQLGEWEDLNTVHAIAAGIGEHGQAFAHWAAMLDRSEWEEDLKNFDDHYRGNWISMQLFAEELLDDLGIDIEEIGQETIRPYFHFDLEAFTRDLAMDYRVSEGEEGVYVFDW